MEIGHIKPEKGECDTQSRRERNKAIERERERLVMEFTTNHKAKQSKAKATEGFSYTAYKRTDRSTVCV